MYFTSTPTSPKTSNILFFLGWLLLLINISAKAQISTTYWTGSQNSEWNDSRNWEGGIPDINKHVIIGERTITNQPVIYVDNQGSNSQSKFYSLTIGGTYSATLTVYNRMGVHIETNLNIQSNGALINQRTNLSIKGEWKNDGVYNEEAIGQGNKWTYIPSVEFIGSTQKISGNTQTKFNHLEIKSAVTLETNLLIELTGYNYGNLIVHSGAVLDPGNKKITWGTNGGVFNLKNGATAKVKATNYLDNYSIRPTAPYGENTIEHTSTIDYAGTIDQNIDDQILYQKLVISGSGVKSLINNTLVSGGAADTEVNVKSATLDLKVFTLDRQAIGGSFTVASGATVKIGGTNTFPAKYTTRTFDANSIVEYYGTNQAVQLNTYGHLTLSTSGTKAMPAAAMSVQGNLTSSGTTTYTAGGALTIGGNVSIGVGSTFNGAAFTHTIAGNWLNNGTFNPGSGTISFVGSNNTSVTGGAVFNVLTINKAAATNTVTLANNATATTLNMTNGDLHTGATNKVIVLGSRAGNGWVVGTITRQHAFASNTPYPFNGPFAILTFTGASGITEVSMKSGLAGFVPTGFVSGKSISRLYQVNVTGGTYTNASLQLQYQDTELNGCVEDGLKLYYSPTGTGTWTNASRHAYSASENWVKRNTVTNLNGFWTLTDNPSTYKWDGTASIAWEDGRNWEVITDGASTRGITGPISSDFVILGENLPLRQPTITYDEWVRDISFKAPNPITLTLSAGSLRTNYNIGTVGAGSAIAHTINTNAQTINIGGNFVLSDGSVGNNLSVTGTAATINLTGNLEQHQSGSIALGSSNLNIGGNYNYTAGTFTGNTSTVTYNGTGDQTVAALPYHHLTINKTAGLATLTSAATQSMTGNLTVTSGTMALNASALNVAGGVTLTAGTLQGNASTIDLKGNWNRTAGTYTPGTSTVNFSGTSPQTVAGTTFHNLSKTATNTLTTTGISTLTGNLDVQSGMLVLDGHTMDRTTTGGTLSVADGATLRINTINYPANYSTNTLGVNSTVIYSGGTAGIAGVTYGNLILQDAASRPLLNNTRVANQMSISGSTTTLSNPTSVYTLTLDKDLASDGVINAVNTNLVFTSPTAKLNGTGTGTTIVKDITINAGGSLTVSKNLTLHGNLTNNGIGFTATNNWVDFTGATAATIASGNAITINELRVNKTGATTTVLLAGDINGLQTINVATGTLDAANRTLTKKAAAGTLLTVANLATFKVAGTNSLPLFDSYTLQPTSTVVYNGFNQTIKSVQYGHLDLINVGVATFEAGTALIAGNLTEGTETTVITPATINYNGTDAQIVASLNYNNLTLSTSGLKTFATGDTRIAEAFTLAGTATANARTNVTNIHYTKTGNQNVLPLSYNSLTLNGSGAKAFSGTTSINGAFALAGTATADLLTAENTIIFDGVTQTVPALNYKNLSVTTAGVKTLAGTIQVEKALALTGGELFTGAANRVILGSTNGSISETGTASGYLKGTLETTRTLTSGASQSFGGIGITITPTTGTPGVTKVTRVTGTTVGSAGKSILRNFNVEPQGTNTNLNATVTLAYQQHELNGLEEVDLIVYTSWTGGDDWKPQNSSAPLNKTVTLGSVQSMARYTLGGRNTPLPVELVYFKATKNGTDAVLEWKTASEQNNESFEIEASADGHTYQKIGNVKSLVGTSALPQNYTYTDNRNGKNGMLYYRLRQVDMDGTFKYYGPRTVNFGTVTKTAITAYPNPFKTEVNVAIETATDGKARLTLYTTAGKKLMQHQEQLLKGASVLQLRMNESLPRGLYLLTIEQNGKTETLKLLKN